MKYLNNKNDKQQQNQLHQQLLNSTEFQSPDTEIKMSEGRQQLNEKHITDTHINSNNLKYPPQNHRDDRGGGGSGGGGGGSIGNNINCCDSGGGSSGNGNYGLTNTTHHQCNASLNNRNYKQYDDNGIITNNSCNMGNDKTAVFTKFFDPLSLFVNSTQTTTSSSSSSQPQPQPSSSSSSSHSSPVPPPTVSLFNLIFYVMCISSVGFSLYANIRQTHYEDRLRHLRHLDDRITILETKIDNFLPFLKYHHRNSKLKSTSSSSVSSSSSSGGTLNNKNIFENGIVDVVNDENNSIQQSSSSTLDDNDDPLADFTNVANVVRKLSVEVQGIQRLRRDVSHLQLTRRQQRQTAVQSSQECMCPPG